jgi:hypothetical protein
LSLVLANRYLGNENWWIETDSLYKLSKRPYEYVLQKDDFIDLITYLRNSFHNTGLFVPSGELKDRHIPWNGRDGRKERMGEI